MKSFSWLTMALFLAFASTSAAQPSKRNPIQEENAKPGSSDWQLTRVRVQPAKGGSPGDAYRSALIEGYCSKQSAAAGEPVDIMASTDPPARFKIEIFRTGYYGGRGARKMVELGPLAAQEVP